MINIIAFGQSTMAKATTETDAAVTFQDTGGALDGNGNPIPFQRSAVAFGFASELAAAFADDVHCIVTADGGQAIETFLPSYTLPSGADASGNKKPLWPDLAARHSSAGSPFVDYAICFLGQANWDDPDPLDTAKVYAQVLAELRSLTGNDNLNLYVVNLYNGANTRERRRMNSILSCCQSVDCGLIPVLNNFPDGDYPDPSDPPDGLHHGEQTSIAIGRHAARLALGEYNRMAVPDPNGYLWLNGGSHTLVIPNAKSVAVGVNGTCSLEMPNAKVWPGARVSVMLRNGTDTLALTETSDAAGRSNGFSKFAAGQYQISFVNLTGPCVHDFIADPHSGSWVMTENIAA